MLLLPMLLQTMTNTKRLLVYIVPVTVLSFSLNIPKFMEVTKSYNLETLSFGKTLSKRGTKGPFVRTK